MKIKRLVLKNFCQYKDVDLSFEAGITGFMGPNGIGKSNFIEGFLMAFTGKMLTSQVRNKGDLIRWGEKDFTSLLELELGDLEVLIERKSKKASITIGDETIDGQNAVTEKLEELMGMSLDLFKDVCFVPQASIKDFLTCPHAERARFFQKLCRLQLAESLRGDIQEVIVQTNPYAEPEVTLEDIALNIRNEKENLKGISEEYKRVTKEVPKEKEVEKLRSLLNITTVSENDLKKKQYKNMLKTLKDELEALPSLKEVPDAPEVTEEMRGIRTKYYQSEENKEKVKDFWKEYHDIESVLKDMVESPFNSNIEKGNEYLSEKKSKMFFQEQIEASAKKGVCVVCGSEYSKSLEEVLKEKDGLETHILAAEAKLKKYIKDNKENDTKYVSLHVRLKELKKNIVNSPIVEVEHDEEKFQKDLSLEKAARQIEKENKRIQEEQGPLKERIIKGETLLKELDNVDTIEDVKVQSAKDTIATYERLKDELTSLDKKKSLSEQAIKTILKEKKSLEKILTYNKTVREELKELEACRDILHREGLPRLVMRRFVNKINYEMTKYFKRYALPFVGYLSDSLDFVVDYGQGFKEKQVGSLSGGQQVALAIIFRFALVDVFASSMPMLVLDEPTAHLDEVNSRKVAEMFDQAKEYAESSMYIFVNSFNEILEQGFSRTIDVADLSSPVYHMNY